MLRLQDVLTRDDGLVLPHLAESYQKLHRTSTAIAAALHAHTAPRSLVLTRANWDKLGETTPDLQERRALVVEGLVRAGTTSSIVRLELSGIRLNGLEPGLMATIAMSRALKTLDLSMNNMRTTQAAGRLAAALQACPSLETLVLHGNRLGHGCPLVAAALAACRNLTYLNMCSCAVATDGLEAIVRSCPGLTRLELCSNEIGTAMGSGGLPHLQYLDLSYNPLNPSREGNEQDDLPALLRGCPRLEHLNLARCELYGPRLLQALQACTDPVTLNLERNPLQTADIENVAGLLTWWPRLAELNLSFTRNQVLTQGVVMALAPQLWGCRRSLKRLKLHGFEHNFAMQRQLMEAWMGPTDGLEFEPAHQRQLPQRLRLR